MRCYYCDAEMQIARQVMLRGVVRYNADLGDADSAAYASFAEQMTYRVAFVCQRCYQQLDNEGGKAGFGKRTFGIAPESRSGKAPIVDELLYQTFLREEAERLGIKFD